MTMYINKNFRTKRLNKERGLNKERENRKCISSKFILLCYFYGDVACMTLSLSNINIRSHVYFPLFMKISLPSFLWIFRALVSF